VSVGAGFWLRWSLRDLRARWHLVAAIAAVLAVGIGMASGLGSMGAWRAASNDRSFALLNAHDLKVTLAEGGTVPQGRLRALVAGPAFRGALADERLSVPTQVDASRGGSAVLVPGRLVGVPVDPGPRVDGLWADGGRPLRPSDAGRDVVNLEANFAAARDLPAQGTVRVLGGATVRWVGRARSPEWFVVAPPGMSWGGDAAYAGVFAPLATAQRLAGLPGRVNELVVRLPAGAPAGDARAVLEARIAERLPQAGATVSTLADEAAYRTLYRDAEGDQQFIDVIAWLVLGGAALAAFNLVSRVVEAERRQIGVGMALGMPSRVLALRPMLVGVQIAVLGTGLGLLVGAASEWALGWALRTILPLPVVVTPFQGGTFARAAILGLVLPPLAAAIPVWRGVRMTPVQAIRVTDRASAGGGLARLARRLPLPGGPVAQMPVRNAFRAPRRTLLTALGIGAAIAVMFSLLGTIDSFFGTVDRSRADIVRGGDDRMIVTLDAARPTDGAVVRGIAGHPVVAAAAPRLVVAGRLRAGGAEVGVQLSSARMDDPVWSPELRQGRLAADAPGVVIARAAAADLGVAVGGTVELEYPVPVPGGTYRLARIRVPVAGVHVNPFRYLAYVHETQLAAVGLGGRADTVEVRPAPGRTRDDVARALFGREGVASVEPAAGLLEQVRVQMQDFVLILWIVEAAGIALAGLIAVNAAGISAEERVREHATMLAFGMRPAAVITGAVAESAIVGLLGSVLGVLAGRFIVGWEVEQVMPRTFPDFGAVVSIAPSSTLWALLLGTAAAAAAPLLTVRRLTRMNLPSALRVVE